MHILIPVGKCYYTVYNCNLRFVQIIRSRLLLLNIGVLYLFDYILNDPLATQMLLSVSNTHVIVFASVLYLIGVELWT